MICRCTEDGQVILKGGRVRSVRVGWEGDIELNPGNKVPPNMEKAEEKASMKKKTSKAEKQDVDKL